MKPCIGFGQVRHTRMRPTHHGFSYPTCFLMLPMRCLHEASQMGLAVNRAGLISFHDKDHGDARSSAQGGALSWLLDVLKTHGIDDANGEIWLHCYPRVIGFTFKPVSFWYCHSKDDQLRAIVIEVNNTFGERHCYLLDQPRYGVTQSAQKMFHVSPFCRVSGSYAFRFMRTLHLGQERTVVRIDHSDDEGLLIHTSVSGELKPISKTTLRQSLWGYPLLTIAVMARIHWNALLLWIKRVPFFHKPKPPSAFVTRADDLSDIQPIH
jgi:hypothetical protein